ncbi:MAG: DUF2288 domain-containing protein [Microcoleaceae cyanobacterium]
MSDLKSQLTENLDEAIWEWLIPHHEKDKVVLVTQQLDLLDVGVAIASDNVASVQQWMSDMWVYKPSEEQVSAWNNNRSKRFNALIVQPFVLVQEIADQS